MVINFELAPLGRAAKLGDTLIASLDSLRGCSGGSRIRGSSFRLHAPAVPGNHVARVLGGKCRAIDILEQWQPSRWYRDCYRVTGRSGVAMCG